MWRSDVVLGVWMSKTKQLTRKSWHGIVEMCYAETVQSKCHLDVSSEGIVPNTWRAICEERNAAVAEVRLLLVGYFEGTEGRQSTTERMACDDRLVIWIRTT
jgi:hypothetical protein